MSDDLNQEKVFVISLIPLFLFMKLLDYLLWVFQLNFKSHFPNLFMEMVNSNVSVPGHPKIALDFIGFFIPLAVSGILLAVSWKVRPELSARKKKIFLIFTGLFILGELISAILPGVVRALWEIFQLYSNLNYATFCLACIYGAYIISLESKRFSYAVSYILGFSIGAVSDVSLVLGGTVGVPGGTVEVLGGAGFIDGDFILPLFMVLAAGVIIFIMGRVKDLHCENDIKT